MGFPINLIVIEKSAYQGTFFSEQFIGAFVGALFAFLFFLLGEYIKRKIEWRIKVRVEHAYLERYFGDLHQIILYNKRLLEAIIKDYENQKINVMNFTLVPIRDDSTMRMRDILFINKVEMYVSNLKRLNLNLNSLNKWKDKINDDLLNSSEETRKRGETILKDFIAEIKDFKNSLEYHLSEIKELFAENRILLKKYKNWKYRRNKTKKENETRKEKIKREIDLINKEKSIHPIMNDYLSKLKKFGLDENEIES